MADLTINKVRVVEWREAHTVPAGEVLTEAAACRVDSTTLKAMLGNASAAVEAAVLGLNTKAVAVANLPAVLLKKGLVGLFTTAGVNVLANMAPGAKVFLSAADSKLADASPSVNAKQTVTLTDATGGTFTLTLGGQTTAAIAYNANAATVQTALQALSTIGSYNCLVTGTGPWTIEFVGALAKQPIATMTGTWTSLTGTGATGAVAVAVAGVLEVVIGKVVVLWDDPTTPSKLLSVDL